METERCPFYGIDCEYIPVAQKVAAQADEIERLQKALNEILEMGEHIVFPIADMTNIARSALQPKESE